MRRLKNARDIKPKQQLIYFYIKLMLDDTIILTYCFLCCISKCSTIYIYDFLRKQELSEIEVSVLINI
jgi:hypothetical protein